MIRLWLDHSMTAIPAASPSEPQLLKVAVLRVIRL